MKALLSISLLCAFCFPGALLLECYTCEGMDCKEPETQKCADENNACMSATYKSMLVESLGIEFEVTSRGCVPVTHCLMNYLTLSSEDVTFRASGQCCYTDRCNNETVSMPPAGEMKPDPNGMDCPRCFLMNSAEECEEGQRMNCTGGETECVEAEAHVSLGLMGDEFNVKIQGCGTPNACHIFSSDAKLAPSQGKTIVTQMKCTQDDRRPGRRIP